MDIDTRKVGEVVVVRLSGRLDTNTSVDFENRINEVLDAENAHVILDFSALEYICSTGLRVIIQAAKKINQIDGKLVLCCLQDYIQEVFEISGFNTFLTIVPTLDKALEKF